MAVKTKKIKITSTIKKTRYYKSRLLQISGTQWRLRISGAGNWAIYEYTHLSVTK